MGVSVIQLFLYCKEFKYICLVLYLQIENLNLSWWNVAGFKNIKFDSNFLDSQFLQLFIYVYNRYIFRLEVKVNNNLLNIDYNFSNKKLKYFTNCLYLITIKIVVY